MANWVKKIDISVAMRECKEQKITIQELAKDVFTRISRLKYRDDGMNEDLKEIAEQFEDLSKSTDDRADATESFDSLLEELYDFGDRTIGTSDDFFNTKKALWVDVIGRA